ncbi:MAG: hypothetical protein KF699_05340 [Phycisphaeraceae bacterium]|nr:hypothetical protein [Phycisphaeraceae bacterium]
MEYKLLDAFRGLFDGVKYEHRRSTLGDHVASFLFEDLVDVGRSTKLVERVRSGAAVVNAANVTVGRKARRGDGTFGDLVPGVCAAVFPGYVVQRGRIAAVDIGVETKILAKAMIQQIDRVISDLQRQAEHFRATNPRALCVGIVGINRAEQYISFEGTRRFKTDGRKHKHPLQEAEEAESRLMHRARSTFDEFIVLKFRATNIRPYPFEWVDGRETEVEYGAALARLSREYDARF